MDTRFFRWMVLTSMCFAISTAQAAEKAERTVKAGEQLTTEAPDLSMKDVLQQKMEMDRQRAMQMRGPRDAQLAEIRQVNEQIEARREAILSENETAAELKAEIAELDQVLVGKAEALTAIFDADEELIALRTKQSEAQAAFQKSQIKLRNEVRQQHRERRQVLEQARQAAAEKAAEAKKTAEAAEKE